MAGYKYFTVLTDVGKQKLVEAIANETALDFTEMAVGDSNGTSYDPTPDMIALKHETYRATISSVSIDEVDRNIMIFQLVVPSSSGGYYIREAGLFSSDGSLIAIARTAEQYKPQLSEGAGASIDINMRIAISSEAQIYINVPESDSYATQNYVKEEFKKHTQEANEKFATKKHNHELSSLNGVLPVNKGGTNTNDGFGWKSAYSDIEFNAKIGLRYPFTTQQLVDAIINLEHPLFCMVHGWRKGQNFIPDFPGSEFSHRTIINCRNQYEFHIETIDPFDLTTYICNIGRGVAGEWINIRKNDGSIPADLISPTVVTYTTDQGTWTETKLTNGKIRLEGWGTVQRQADAHTVYLPKKVSEGSVILSFISYGLRSMLGTRDGIKSNSSSSYFQIITAKISDVSTGIISADWYVTAILA